MKSLTNLINIDRIFNRTVFQPPVRDHVHPDIKSVKVESLGKLPIDYIYIQSPNMKSNYCILYSHGNAEDVTSLMLWGKYLADKLNINILFYDYPGYGRTQGKISPSEMGCYHAISAMYQLLRVKYKHRTKNIIPMGVSIGTGPTIDLAASERQFAGVILVAPFTSCAKIFIKFDLMDGCDMFHNESKIDKVKSPVLMIHGRQDKLITPSHSLQLFSKIPPKFRYHLAILDNVGHNNLPENPEYLSQIEQYISDLKDLK